jgi:hypothetical protein
MAIDGFLLSQGECDADCNNTAYYSCAFPRFIQDWRAAFQAPDAFFSFQVLPALVALKLASPTPAPHYSLPTPNPC